MRRTTLIAQCIALRCAAYRQEPGVYIRIPTGLDKLFGIPPDGLPSRDYLKIQSRALAMAIISGAQVLFRDIVAATEGLKAYRECVRASSGQRVGQ